MPARVHLALQERVEAGAQECHHLLCAPAPPRRADALTIPRVLVRPAPPRLAAQSPCPSLADEREAALTQLAAAHTTFALVARGDPNVADPDRQLNEQSESALDAASALLGWLINEEDEDGEEEDGEEGDDLPPPQHGDDFKPPPPPPSAGHLNFVAGVA